MAASTGKLCERIRIWPSGTSPTHTCRVAQQTEARAGNVFLNRKSMHSQVDAGFIVGLQAVFLGYEITDNHIVGYLGQRDARGRFYYFPFNGGNTTVSGWYTPFSVGISYTADQGTGFVLGFPDNANRLGALIGQPVLVKLGAKPQFGGKPYPSQVQAWISAHPDLQGMIDEQDAAVTFASKLLLLSADAYSTGLATSTDYPTFSSWINSRVTTVQVDRLPVPVEIGSH